MSDTGPSNLICYFEIPNQNINNTQFEEFVNSCALCIRKDDKKYRIVLGICAVVIAIVGILGNLLTLLAIPYAARKKRYTFIKYYISNF